MLQAVINSSLTGAVYQRIPFSEAYRLADGFIDLYEPRARDRHRKRTGPTPASGPRTDKAMPPTSGNAATAS